MELIILVAVAVAVIIVTIVFVVKIIAAIIYSTIRRASFSRMSNYILQDLELNQSKNIICFDDTWTSYYNRALVIDDLARKICILSQENKKIYSKLYSFSEIVSSQIGENGTTVTETSLDNAIAGGLLFGKTGAIVGGLAGKTSTSNKINEISLNLIFNDKINPFYKFVFARCLGEGMDKTDKIYISGWNDLNQWHSTFCLIIEENKKKNGKRLIRKRVEKKQKPV